MVMYVLVHVLMDTRQRTTELVKVMEGFVRGYVRIVKPNLDIDECASNPCPNNSSCENLPGTYRCNCATGYRYESRTCVGE